MNDPSHKSHNENDVSEQRSESEFEEPANLTEAIINLYLSIKIRKEDEELNKSKIEEEKIHLLNVEPCLILEYIRKNFEILMNLKMEESKEKSSNSGNGPLRSGKSN